MPSQAKRFAEFVPPSGADALVLTSFVGREQISQPFEFQVELQSTDGEINFDDLIGQKAAVRIDLAGGSKRWFHGIVARFMQTQTDGRHAAYRARIVPWFWLLTRASDCRIFQGKSVPDIVKEVFDAHGFSEYELRLSGSYQAWDYCVQYRETDFNFVSRMLEQEGIYYFFEHSETEHKLVLADSPSAHQPFPGVDSLPYRPPRHDKEEREESVTSWMIEKEVQTGAYAVKDFSFEQPDVSLLGASSISRQHEKAEYEIFDYPGEFEAAGEADGIAKLRIQELQARYEILAGDASARSIATGSKLALTDHPRDDQNREYLITGTTIDVRTGEYESGGGDEGQFFSCTLTAIPFENAYRAPRITPKPIIQGPQTAIVVGPGGDEIHTDAFGRVKLQFHWDRHGKSDENSSCWVRVSQTGWAGDKWGGIHIPRIGQEVIVEFLEGDPDRPIVTGRVYNGKNGVPYELPGKKTQSGIKSRSTLDGTDENYNEIRFEDLKGSEQIVIHAEKDKIVEVENDNSETIGHDEKVDVGNDRSKTVANDETVSIGNNRTEDVTKNESITIGENRTTDVGKNEQLTIGDNNTISVGKDQKLDITDNRTTTVGKDDKTTISGNRVEDVTKDSKIKVGKALAVDAADEISLKSGSASITLKKDGTITIKGKDINIEGSGKIQVKASSDVIIKGSKIAEN